ncbi:MAG: histidine triad nucleotide-binding protein [Deltaproteobacteria bacterium]|nr:histidine triad nucleotide-binding protein [Deltaproteobacteria bacterium]
MSDCLFCNIVEGSIPSHKVYEDDDFLAFKDIKPQSPVHVLVLPKRHVEQLSHCGEEDKDLLSGLMLTANRVAKKLGIDSSGFRVAINSGKEGGQVVFHLHLHLMGGARLSDQMA